MIQAVTIGPLSFSVTLLVGLAGAVLGGAAGHFADRRRHADVGGLLFWAALAGLGAARLVFVLQYHDAYLQAPLAILDIRDGGWAPLAGCAAAALAIAVAAVRRRVARVPLAVAVATAAGVWVLAAASLASLPEDDDSLPAITLPALDGAQVALASFRGKPVVVNLWATWCPPCRRELPALLQAQAEHPEVHFVFLDQGESGERVRGFLAAQQLPLRNVLLDLHGQAGARLASRALPTTLFFDARGRLVATRVGELSRASLAARLAATATPE